MKTKNQFTKQQEECIRFNCLENFSLSAGQMLSVKGGNGGGDDEDIQDDGYV